MKDDPFLKYSLPQAQAERGRWFSVLLCVIVLLMITSRPFEFSRTPKGWDRDFYPRDLLQNVILFLPLGILLRRRPSLPWIWVVVGGALVSSTIEIVQLYMPQRFSNVLDIVCNSAGTLLGGLTADWAFRDEKSGRLNELMTDLILLCWVTGMGVLGDPLSSYAVVCFSAVGMTIFFKYRTLSPLQRWAALLFCSGLNSAFFFYSLRLGALHLLPLVLIVNWRFMSASNLDDDMVLGATAFGGGLLLVALLLRLALQPPAWDLWLRVLQFMLFLRLLYFLRARREARCSVIV